jgi:hypothetical protein
LTGLELVEGRHGAALIQRRRRAGRRCA